MTEQARRTAEYSDYSWHGGPTRNGPWAGWIGFAGIMMIVIGIFGFIEGLVALVQDDFYVAGPSQILLFDLTGWGWTHLVLGALIAVAGAALWTGAVWARVVAVLFAVVNAIAQIGFLSVQPVWSTIMIGLCVVVVWAIVVHGSEIERP
ncbi:DUF7144 family membrane protein [Actinokineospora globicatena]|uniref:Membrane protein n=1 Tax=Actinokineospora globicatena TaxID=103729 RepID=A0A9W6QIF8_9PSEU|nr:hypothetical protein [Actinokineospora globicatena]GLW90057.1 membrane protein [Actinokineospora globicatena]